MKNKVDSMSKIGGYASYDVGFQNNIYEKAKSENKRTDKKPVEKYGAAQPLASKQPELSQGAKDLLNEMQKKYGDMDFFVADYSSDDEAQRYLSRGSKEYSVLIEPELLEKMAADESVKEKYLGIIEISLSNSSASIQPSLSARFSALFRSCASALAAFSLSYSSASAIVMIA